jgi:hypothetical protein
MAVAPGSGNGGQTAQDASSRNKTDLGHYIANRVREAIEQALVDREDLLKRVAKAGGDAAATGIVGDVGSLVDVLTGAALGALVLGPEVDAAIGLAKAAESAAGPQGTGYGLGYLLGTIGFQALEPWLLPLDHFMNAESQFQIFDPGTAAQLAARRITGADFAQSEAEGGGFNDNRFKLLAEAAQSWPALGETLELLRRGRATEAEVVQALERNGVPEEWIPRLLDLQRILLSPSDLALSQLRGNITTEEATTYAERLGVDADDLKILVGNTGEPPGLEEMLLAYRLGYIDDATLDHGIRQSRVKNEWIPLVKKLRFRPPPTADAIKASVEHYISQDKAKGIAAQNGLNPDEFDWVWQSWGEPISKTEALSLWRRGLIDQATVEQALREGRLKDKYISTVLELKRELLPIRQIEAVVQHGVQPPEWGINELMDRGLTHQDAADWIGVVTEGKAAVHKELAQGLILDMYEAKGITEAEAVHDLGQLGWTEEQAHFIIATQDAKQALAEQHKAQNAIRSARLAGRLTDHQARDQLAQVGVLGAATDLLLKDWRIEAESRVKEPTSTEIAQSAENGGITFEQGLKALQRLGYTRDGAAIVLTANKVPLPKDFKITEPAGL